jgi:hypothetical protein
MMASATKGSLVWVSRLMHDIQRPSSMSLAIDLSRLIPLACPIFHLFDHGESKLKLKPWRLGALVPLSLSCFTFRLFVYFPLHHTDFKIVTTHNSKLRKTKCAETTGESP